MLLVNHYPYREDRILLSMPEDHDIFHALLRAVPKPAGRPDDPGELLLAVATFFLDTPFAPQTLEQENGEQLVINLRQLDCFTLVENTVVLARLIRTGQTTWPEFAAALQASRYRQGRLDGYADRLHYFSDWLDDNQSQGLLQDITPALGGTPWRKEINFMTAHRNQYLCLGSLDTYRRLLRVEKTCSARSYHHIPQASVPVCSRQIKNGDLIAITTAIAGLDVVHVGLAVHLPRGLHLLHASQRAGRVIISPETLYRYLRQRKSRLGIMVARVL
ncbi:MAG: DUF1460 domain-containing protein [Deltaproteobacteria bacterium]|nr:DUF1460 domain-containing protein [Deltaproteobacteria bacterium]